jgi:polyphosphate kinase
MSASALPTPVTSLDDPSLYINRELSWLEFNRRVLEEAADLQVPLLERLKFIAIFSSNLEEFFMVRVGNIIEKAEAGLPEGSGADRVPPAVQLTRINERVQAMTAEQYRILYDELIPALAQAGIRIVDLKDLTAEDIAHLQGVFRKQILPVLTPLAIDPGHPFPHLANKSHNLAILLQRPRHNETLFAVVQVPAVLPRFVALPTDRGHAFVALETVIRMHLPELFLGMELVHASAFQVIRDREYEIDDDEVEDLLKTIEEELRKRRRGAAVHLYVEASTPPSILSFLINSLDLGEKDVTLAPGLLDLTGLVQIYQVPSYAHLRDPIHVPKPVAEIVQAPNIWAAIRARDILMHHPYEAFAHVVDFIETAADDDKVLAIKQTLYRTGTDSPIMRALQRAADNGKQVTVLVELKARMDEERNIVWARQLEQAGVHVVFGFINLKTHCKVALVVRREEDGLRRYVHLSTGNYNPQTARIYTDLGFFTCKDDFGEDVSALFNYLTGYSETPQWRKLVIAPSRMQPMLLQKIEREIEIQKGGGKGRIIAKLNGLLEPAMVKALYRASQGGVQVDLVCRGVCSLRPGLPGISENIRVVSIVDRFLEHSRIFYFGNGGDPQVYIGSADWMDRNLSRRVEVIFPIEQPDLKRRLIEEILATSLADNVKARLLFPDGHWERVPTDPENRVRSQERFLTLAAEAAARISSEPGIMAPVPTEGVSTERKVTRQPARPAVRRRNAETTRRHNAPG